MTIHFQRIPQGGSYPPAEPDWWKARFYLGGQKYVAVFPPPDVADVMAVRAVGDELQAKANELGVAVQLLVRPNDLWNEITPQPVERYAFVITTEAGAELVTRGGRLVVAKDPGVLAPPCVAVKFSGDPAWTVPVADEPAGQP